MLGCPAMLFTFQYVSINTEERLTTNALGEDLHSNMFLLILQETIHHYERFCIYIPICFY